MGGNKYHPVIGLKSHLQKISAVYTDYGPAVGAYVGAKALQLRRERVCPVKAGKNYDVMYFSYFAILFIN